MSGWQHVWECPQCGLQLAWGDQSSDVRVTVDPPTCQLLHAPVEMEQKLSEAMAFGPEETP